MAKRESKGVFGNRDHRPRDWLPYVRCDGKARGKCAVIMMRSWTWVGDLQFTFGSFLNINIRILFLALLVNCRVMRMGKEDEIVLLVWGFCLCLFCKHMRSIF